MEPPTMSLTKTREMQTTAEWIDAFASGHHVDPSGSCRALKPRELSRYVDAKIQGFVVKSPGVDAQAMYYYHWCTYRNIPFIMVSRGVRTSDVIYNADTTGYPPTCKPGPDVFDQIGDFVDRLCPEKQPTKFLSIENMDVLAVPHAKAILIGRKMWDLVKPYCIGPAEGEALRKSIWLAN
jgi:hypothetical protein